MTFKNGMRPVHPGEVLREEYLKPLGLSANALAKAPSSGPARTSYAMQGSSTRNRPLS
jgi:plasmid maintenance system antidote protein VapI